MANELKNLMDSNFMGYASYVIKERAIPEIEDGLKPVQRRILHSLHEVDDNKFHKVANIVGHTMKYHPHGDASISDALVNIAQKNFFIEQQGNFGNVITGDPASAARYIECKISALAKETMFNDEITDYVDSYDGRNKEPVVFPAKIPVLLMCGVEGIAVGLSTKILPHNFIELLESQIKIIKGEDFEIYPDFPHAGSIDVSDYQNGKGRIKIRAKIEVTDNKTLLIKEIPFGTTTESIIASIENAINKGKLKISSINDFTTEKVEIELKIGHGVNAESILPRLFLYTDCEIITSSNVTVIKKGLPVETDVKEILHYNTTRLIHVLERELNTNLLKLKAKLHEKIITRIFIKNKIYSLLEEVDDFKQVEKMILLAFDDYKEELVSIVTNDYVDKLLSIPIKRISKFDLKKTIEEIEDINKEIERINNNLKNINKYTIKYIENLINKYKDIYVRKTEIGKFESIDITKVAVLDLKVGYDKKTNYLGSEIKAEDFIQCSSFDKVLILFKNGDYKVINIPEKLFLEGKILNFFRQGELRVIHVIYSENDTGIHYMKKFVVNKFIIDKVYRFIPENSKLVYFSMDENPIIQIDYSYQKRAKISTEYIHLGRLLTKSVTAMGNQVSTKPISKISNAKKDVLKMFEAQPEEVMRLKPPSEEIPTLFET
ncbi:MAG: DNA topoisomerase IV subunit A [Cyanobacteriota bacterium]